MKIVRRGTPPNEILWRGTCHACKTVATAGRSELKVEEDPREGGEFGRATCPVCGDQSMIFYPVKK